MIAVKIIGKNGETCSGYIEEGSGVLDIAALAFRSKIKEIDDYLLYASETSMKDNGGQKRISVINCCIALAWDCHGMDKEIEMFEKMKEINDR